MMKRQTIVFLSTALLLFTALPALAQQGSRPGELDLIVPVPTTPDTEARAALDALFYDYHVLEVDLSAVTRQVKNQSGLKIHLGNQIKQLELELNDLRDPAYRAVVIDAAGVETEVRPPVATYRGSVVGEPGSIVRLTALPDLFTGYIKTEEEWLFIDPLSEHVKGQDAGKVVVYRDADVRPDASKTCGAEHFRAVAKNLELPKLDGIALKAPRRMDVATEADGQYYQRYGNPGLFNRITSILNGVDGLYQAQINITLNITYQQAWSSIPGDPYTSLNATTTLFQFRNWWNANRGGTVRDIAHQFSGKNFSGGTIGIAWVGVVCNNASLSYGVSEDQSSSFLNTQLTAHEIGHNLSAGHDNQSPICPGVNCNGFGPIMCSFIQSNGSNQFSNCSKNSIASHTSSFGFCLN